MISSNPSPHQGVRQAHPSLHRSVHPCYGSLMWLRQCVSSPHRVAFKQGYTSGRMPPTEDTHPTLELAFILPRGQLVLCNICSWGRNSKTQGKQPYSTCLLATGDSTGQDVCTPGAHAHDIKHSHTCRSLAQSGQCLRKFSRNQTEQTAQSNVVWPLLRQPQDVRYGALCLRLQLACHLATD